MVKLFSLKSPDEWATTKQACRDTYVVTCFLPSTIRILALLYVLSTVLQISSSNLLYIYTYVYISLDQKLMPPPPLKKKTFSCQNFWA